MKIIKNFLFCVCFLIPAFAFAQQEGTAPVAVSGIYPRLAYYNKEGECGTGAVVHWANRLWVISYSPHSPHGSTDKLYEITPDYRQIVRKESIGGTPADRMIHRESDQLFIGPYVIDRKGKVRVIPWQKAPGRYTGIARHLTDPSDSLYIGTMEEGLYEVNVHDLGIKTLYVDGNEVPKKKGELIQYNSLLPGAHGKGLYSGQGVLVYANNGEATEEALEKFDVPSGVLAEWNGKLWRPVRRNQFADVTGPGGIYGNPHPESDPIWTIGFDYKSLIVGVREVKKGWSFYRLPKASHSYDGAHGWNTEWPRIRDVGTVSHPDFLMTMHGMFWKFPSGFSSRNSGGIRPRSAYLKVTGDFTRWQDRLVFGCDDCAKDGFLNHRKEAGNIGRPGQSNSNLWFTSLSKVDELGPTTADGSVWLRDTVKAGERSEPFLFSGWPERCCWLKNYNDTEITFDFEVDRRGRNEWMPLKTVTVDGKGSCFVHFTPEEKGEWIRILSEGNAVVTACYFYTGQDSRDTQASSIFKGLATIRDSSYEGGLLYDLGNDRRTLGVLADRISGNKITEQGYYELNENLRLVHKNDPKMENYIRSDFAIPQNIVGVDKGSVLIVDGKGRRWRLPLSEKKYLDLSREGILRMCREVVTERDLMDCMGTFYELPADNADGYAKIRPVSSHNYLIRDYASYRGMLVMTGINPAEAGNNEHIIRSDDGQASVWVGTIDDLWEMGKPRGEGGPWKETEVKAGKASDPYLIGFYDKKTVALSHNDTDTVTFTMEVDPVGDGNWMKYSVVKVAAGEKYVYRFPSSFQARWIRFYTDKDTKATAWLEYK